MTVRGLIDLLQKVEHKEADVYLGDSELITHMLASAVIEHDLSDDEIVVILKTR